MTLSLLENRLLNKVTVFGKTYEIYTDFRRWIQVETLLFEEKGDFVNKISALLSLCYPTLPETLEHAICGIAKFYAGDEISVKRSSSGKKPIYSFVQDEVLIYAGFYQQYGIDLTKADLHWWQFKALLAGLSEETKLMQVLHFRSVDLSAIKNLEEKKFYRRMKDLYKLRDTRTKKEQQEAIAAALADLF